MNHKTTLSISEARKKIFEIAEEVQKPGIHYTFTENGRPKAVLMSAEEFESWEETLEVMKIFPNPREVMEETDAAIKSGEYKNWPTLEDLIAKEALTVADRPKKSYDVSTHSTTGRRKTTRKDTRS